MHIKRKVFAATAALTLAGGVAAVAGTAGAATPSCGSTCPDVFSREFGTHANPLYVVDVYRQAAKPGQKVILFRSSNTDPAEDFSGEFDALTSSFYQAGLVSAAVALRYGCTVGTGAFQFSSCAGEVNDPAFELEYAPFGADSGLCVGVAANATQGEGVTLQACGASARTVWILDLNDSPSTITHGYVPVINGSDSNFSHPFVLSYPAAGFPTDNPRPQLQVRNLTGFSQGNTPLGNPIGNVDDTQLWGSDFGILK